MAGYRANNNNASPRTKDPALTCDTHPTFKKGFSGKKLQLIITKDSVRVTGVRSVLSGSLSPQHGASSVCGWRNGLQYGGWLRIYCISSRGQPTRRGPPAWGLREVLTTRRKNLPGYETDARALGPGLILRGDTRFGTWNVRVQGRFTAVREMARYELDLLRIQEIRWDKGAQYDVSMEEETKIINWEQDFLYTIE